MSFTVVRMKKETQADPTAVFWSKVERIFGDIPKLIRLILEFNGFDTLLALKGIRWDDKKLFFEALEESITSLVDLEDSEDIKRQFLEELAANHQQLKNFKLKLGHKNLIINLCHELQKTNIEDLNIIQVPDVKRVHQELIVRKPEEHGYAHEKNLKRKASSESEEPQFTIVQSPQHGSQHQDQDVSVTEEKEQIQYVYENEEEDDGTNFIEQEFLEELEPFEGDAEIVEYQEVHTDEAETDDCIYTSEQIIKQEADQYEQAERYEMSGYESSSSLNRSGPKNKKPKHMYTEEFLQTQMTQGRIGTPGRRRPKIQKHYPDTEEGLLERWCDLVRQSCEVIVPTDLLSQHDLSHVEIVKIHDSIWEVKCPLCTKKLRLQLTHEGKYTNYKRSNFERHLRIVHYKQILQFKAYMSDDENMFEETIN